VFEDICKARFFFEGIGACQTMARWWLNLEDKYMFGSAYDGIHRLN